MGDTVFRMLSPLYTPVFSVSCEVSFLTPSSQILDAFTNAFARYPTASENLFVTSLKKRLVFSSREIILLTVMMKVVIITGLVICRAQFLVLKEISCH